MAQAAHAISRTWRRLIGYCERIYLFIRISTLGFTLLLPLLGSASGQHALTNGTTLLMISVGLAFHIFAYVLNDVVDLRLDRTEPLRADSPLVQGTITRRRALWLAFSQPPLAFVIAYLAGVTLVALYMLGAAFLSRNTKILPSSTKPTPTNKFQLNSRSSKITEITRATTGNMTSA